MFSLAIYQKNKLLDNYPASCLVINLGVSLWSGFTHMRHATTSDKPSHTCNIKCNKWAWDRDCLSNWLEINKLTRVCTHVCDRRQICKCDFLGPMDFCRSVHMHLTSNLPVRFFSVGEPKNGIWMEICVELIVIIGQMLTEITGKYC